MKEFINHSREAKITIELDDYKVTMNGRLEPPMKISKYSPFDEDLMLGYQDPNSGIEIVDNQVTLRVNRAENIKIEKTKWIIPLSTRPRIEND